MMWKYSVRVINGGIREEDWRYGRLMIPNACTSSPNYPCPSRSMQVNAFHCVMLSRVSQEAHLH